MTWKRNKNCRNGLNFLHSWSIYSKRRITLYIGQEFVSSIVFTFCHLFKNQFRLFHKLITKTGESRVACTLVRHGFVFKYPSISQVFFVAGHQQVSLFLPNTWKFSRVNFDETFARKHFDLSEATREILELNYMIMTILRWMWTIDYKEVHYSSQHNTRQSWKNGVRHEARKFHSAFPFGSRCLTAILIFKTQVWCFKFSQRIKRPVQMNAWSTRPSIK